jgi:CTP synthase
MQAAVIEYTRSFLNRPLANSKEFSPSIDDQDAAVIFMPEGDKEKMGGTMRLGARNTLLRDNTIAKSLYVDSIISERHRHRYEVNPQLVSELESKGLLFSGKDLETSQRMEIIELQQNIHPYFVAVQFHPEFQSRPLRPSPVFLGNYCIIAYK